ncbi:MAG: hypothetical protein MJD61_02215 [Proteobacteria bacterium]|nr:hypothetical protein [Pseudomonadota bacterium]
MRALFVRGLMALTLAASVLGAGCGEHTSPPDTRPAPPPPPKPTPHPHAQDRTVDQRPPPMAQPVPLWAVGRQTKMIDAATASVNSYLVLDIGEEWTPYIFTDGVDTEGNPAPNSYRKTYLELAHGRWPDNHHGERARKDKYLELYGIMPTLSVLRKRFRATTRLKCAQDLDLQPLQDFTDDFVTYRSNEYARRQVSDYFYLKKFVKGVMRQQGTKSIDEIDQARLNWRDKDRVRRYRRQASRYHAVLATQRRLKCEGYFRGIKRYVRGGLDWPTHNALAEFERRHRVYGWGFIGKDSLRVLRMTSVEAEREGVLRVLTERALHAAGVIEDGSTSTLRDGQPRTFKGVGGEDFEIPNLEQQLREAIVRAFGLHTPESTLAWLEGLGALEKDKQRLLAFKAPDLPEYYDGNMSLTLIYDRGDVWYDFPFTVDGKQKSQPVQRRPRVTVFTEYEGQMIPLARYGTTIGGWRSEFIDGVVWWKYKESPVGERMWKRIVAAPVWFPPDSTPPRELLRRREKRKAEEPKFEVNYHETGPSYASAYGLVAAYHLKFMRTRDGDIREGIDEGIRTHGSVDYMSIMRRHSHGCHRLHNHIAVRLMSFVLAHRPHKRLGQAKVIYEKELEYEEQIYPLVIEQGGYEFELEQPLIVNVLEGRIRGETEQPLAFPVPKFDKEVGAYLLPDGGAVELQGTELVAVPRPQQPDAGLADAAFATAELAQPPLPDSSRSVALPAGTAPMPGHSSALGSPAAAALPSGTALAPGQPPALGGSRPVVIGTAPRPGPPTRPAPVPSVAPATVAPASPAARRPAKTGLTLGSGPRLFR